MKWKLKPQKNVYEWHPWFAWHPVSALGQEGWCRVWGEKIYRRLRFEPYILSTIWEYSLPELITSQLPDSKIKKKNL